LYNESALALRHLKLAALQPLTYLEKLKDFFQITDYLAHAGVDGFPVGMGSMERGVAGIRAGRFRA
jgi:hypothetical protein